MLAELAAANAAFAVIKSAVQNSGDLLKAGSAITNFVAAKEELTRRKNKKTGKGVPASDLEEFLALEEITLWRLLCRASPQGLMSIHKIC